MSADNSRIVELRRRLLLDPASIAFAQLAEEHRRVGEHEEAIRVARLGLARYPGYLSARVTLGRALLSLDRLDEARLEFEAVLQGAADNLSAAKGLAEIQERTGEVPALTPAKASSFVEQVGPEPLVNTDVQRSEPPSGTDVRLPRPEPPSGTDVRPPRPEPSSSSLAPAEVLFDLDKLLEQLDERSKAPGPPPAPAVLSVAPDIRPVQASPILTPSTRVSPIDDDVLRELEMGLAEFERARANSGTGQQGATTLSDLESWLAAILADRHRRSGA